MFTGLKFHPKEGDRVKVTLIFAPSDQRVDVEIPVLIKRGTAMNKTILKGRSRIIDFRKIVPLLGIIT